MEQDQKIIKKMVGEIVEINQKNEKKDLQKFSKIVPSLMKKGLENLNLSMFSPDIKAALLFALGEEYRRKGNLSDSVKCFVMAGAKNKLNQVAYDYEILAQFENCIDVYKLSGNYQKLLELGKKLLNDGRLAYAVKAFTAIGDNEKLIKIGEECVNKCRFDYAFEIFSTIKDRQKLVEFGDKCIEEKEYGYAVQAYNLAGAKDQLNEVGDICLKEEKLSRALEAYGLAENTMMVDFIKENFHD